MRIVVMSKAAEFGPLALLSEVKRVLAGAGVWDFLVDYVLVKVSLTGEAVFETES